MILIYFKSIQTFRWATSSLFWVIRLITRPKKDKKKLYSFKVGITQHKIVNVYTSRQYDSAILYFEGHKSRIHKIGWTQEEVIDRNVQAINIAGINCTLAWFDLMRANSLRVPVTVHSCFFQRFRTDSYWYLCSWVSITYYAFGAMYFVTEWNYLNTCIVKCLEKRHNRYPWPLPKPPTHSKTYLWTATEIYKENWLQMMGGWSRYVENG